MPVDAIRLLTKTMTTDLNPYQTPPATQSVMGDHAESRFRGSVVARYSFAIWLIVYLYPVWFLGSVFLAWLNAWFQLGYPPRPMLDDPKNMGGISTITYCVFVTLLMLMPVLTPLGFAASFFCPINKQRKSRITWGGVLSVFYVVICVTVALTIRFGAPRIMEWLLD